MRKILLLVLTAITMQNLRLIANRTNSNHHRNQCCHTYSDQYTWNQDDFLNFTVEEKAKLLKQNHNLIIIGSGPAGLTAAIYAARSNLEPLVIEGDMPGGQLIGTSAIIENWPGEKSILGATLVMKMRDHAQHLGATFLAENVVKVDFSKKPYSIWTDENTFLRAHALIIATGTVPKTLDCPGLKQYWGQGISSCALCDGPLYTGKPVMIIGGGYTALKYAIFMTKFTNKVTLVHTGDTFKAPEALIRQTIENPHISIIYHSTISAFMGNGMYVTEAEVTNLRTSEKKILAVDGVFMAIGTRPNTDIFVDQLRLEDNGYIWVKNMIRSSREGIFCAGIVADQHYRQLSVCAGMGCMAALEAYEYLKNAGFF